MARITDLDKNSLTAKIYYTAEEAESMRKSDYDVESVYYPIEDRFELIAVEADVMTWATADMIWSLYDMGEGILYYMSENELRNNPREVTLKAIRLSEEDIEEIENELRRA